MCETDYCTYSVPEWGFPLVQQGENKAWSQNQVSDCFTWELWEAAVQGAWFDQDSISSCQVPHLSLDPLSLWQGADTGRKNLHTVAVVPGWAGFPALFLPTAPTWTSVTSSWHRHGGSPELLLPKLQGEAEAACSFLLPACSQHTRETWRGEYWAKCAGQAEVMLQTITFALLACSKTTPPRYKFKGETR